MITGGENIKSSVMDNLGDLVRERTIELERTREVAIDAMALIAEWRDPSAGAHIKRTKHYVLALAQHLKKNPKYRDFLNDKTIELLGLSAPLHDVGKVSIPDSILLKPDKLSFDEFEEMKSHTTKGKQVLASARLGGNSFLAVAQDIAHYHHERWDGKGYPRGLAKDEIPLCAAIMSVADVYDALISKRPYKEPIAHSTALDLMLHEEGTQFSPVVMEAFLAQEKRFMEIAQKYTDEFLLSGEKEGAIIV